MALMAGRGRSCPSAQVTKGGKTTTGKQRHRGHQLDGTQQSCLLGVGAAAITQIRGARTPVLQPDILSAVTPL
jgi:hypothetical protein